MNSKLQKSAYSVLFVFTCIFIISLFFFQTTTNLISNTVTITVSGKDQIAATEDNKSTKFIYANGTTYEVSDSWMDMQFNSRDVYGSLQVGRTYLVKTRGIRFGWFSMQPNIVKVYQQYSDWHFEE
jgi:hypothetical protein